MSYHPTERHLEYLELMALGYKHGEIAETLGLSRHTVSRAIAIMQIMMGATTPPHAITIAVKMKWIDLDNFRRVLDVSSN